MIAKCQNIPAEKHSRCPVWLQGERRGRREGQFALTAPAAAAVAAVSREARSDDVTRALLMQELLCWASEENFPYIFDK